LRRKQFFVSSFELPQANIRPSSLLSPLKKETIGRREFYIGCVIDAPMDGPPRKILCPPWGNRSGGDATAVAQTIKLERSELGFG